MGRLREDGDFLEASFKCSEPPRQQQPPDLIVTYLSPYASLLALRADQVQKGRWGKARLRRKKPMNDVWVFNGEGGTFPAGVFAPKEDAEGWNLCRYRHKFHNAASRIMPHGPQGSQTFLVMRR
jgi:hypothetical protein